MFHNTHAYFASEVHGKDAALLLVGSILPDLAITGIISWEKNGLHDLTSVRHFTEYVADNYPTCIELAQGIMNHYVLDTWTHTSYRGRGYAYLNNSAVVAQVEVSYGLTSQDAENKAHNYLESAVDLLLLQQLPAIQTRLRNAINVVDQDLIAKILAGYFKVALAEVRQSLKDFFRLFGNSDFRQQTAWIDLWYELEGLLGLKHTAAQERKQLLELSLASTKPTYEKFLVTAIKHERL